MAHSTPEGKDIVSIRPPGPLKVWDIVECVSNKEQGQTFKFTIQEIPEDRYEEVLDHMCKFFIADEPLCDSQNGKDDPEYIASFRRIWRDVLKQGLSVAAFVGDPSGGTTTIAGVNILGLDFKGDKHDIEDFKISSEKAKRVFRVILGLSDVDNLYETYGVDRHMYALGLSVHPYYRGLALGGHILKAREKIGQAYKIPLTSTAFTSPISQKLAARCGFEVLLEKDYVDIKDDEGNMAFPKIKAKTFKIMARRLY